MGFFRATKLLKQAVLQSVFPPDFFATALAPFPGRWLQKRVSQERKLKEMLKDKKYAEKVSKEDDAVQVYVKKDRC